MSEWERWQPTASVSVSIVQSTNERNSSEKKQLPDGFFPGINDIICGKGSECFNHIGNKYYRQILEDNMKLYFSTASKKGKSWLISEIVSEIRNKSYPGGFVRRDLLSGRFTEVGEFAAREKTSHALREMLTRDGLSHKADVNRRLIRSDKSSIKFSVATSPAQLLSSFPCLTGERNEEHVSFQPGVMEAPQFINKIDSPSALTPNTTFSLEDQFDCFVIGTSDQVMNKSNQFQFCSENDWNIRSPCPQVLTETIDTTNEIVIIYNQWKNENNGSVVKGYGFSTR